MDVQVERGNAKPPPAVEETYRGVAAPSRPKVDEAPQVMEMPKVRLPDLDVSLQSSVTFYRTFAVMPHLS